MTNTMMHFGKNYSLAKAIKPEMDEIFVTVKHDVRKIATGKSPEFLVNYTPKECFQIALQLAYTSGFCVHPNLGISVVGNYEDATQNPVSRTIDFEFYRFKQDNNLSKTEHLKAISTLNNNKDYAKNVLDNYSKILRKQLRQMLSKISHNNYYREQQILKASSTVTSNSTRKRAIKEFDKQIRTSSNWIPITIKSAVHPTNIGANAIGYALCPHLVKNISDLKTIFHLENHYKMWLDFDNHGHINNYVFVDSPLKGAGQALEDKQFVFDNIIQMMQLIQKYC